MAKKLLLHICCAHCAAYPVEYFRGLGCEVSGLFYNPNIHPFTEHENRKTAVVSLSQIQDFPLVIPDGYDMPEYFRLVAGNEKDRCRYCFDLRLSRTAKEAKGRGFDAFSTTLLISRHADHAMLKATGERLAAEYGVEFHYVDFRKRFSDSHHIAKPYNLYKQQYCGCVYSEWERYREQ
jgi:epoxyqueuosine reductase